jgi:predicted ATPase
MAALALAKLLQSTGETEEAHAILSDALEGFAPTPLFPTIAEAQALLAVLAETEEVETATAQRERRVKLQTAYARALMWTKGYASEEAKDAFARAREMSGGTDDAAERFPAYYAQFVRSYVRAEWPQARATAETFLREAEEGAYATEACAARRCLGTACLFQGDLGEARVLLERALADYAPARDAPTRFRFGADTGVMAAAPLALVMWRLGEAGRAHQLTEQAIQRAAELGHAPTSATMYSLGALLDAERDDPTAALRSAEMAHALGREHGMRAYVAGAEAVAGWARGRLHDPEVGAHEFRRALADYFDQGNKVWAPLYHGMLAQLEAATRGPDAALTLIDRGLAIATETGERYTDPYLHRLRGDILLKRDPANPALAEEAFQTAIALAKEQGARSYELLASLSLAKLYQSTGRPLDANVVLAPALEGFTPTPEMCEIAEAQTLLAALAETGERKAAAEQSRRRLDLQTSYGRALIWAKGFAAEETNAAFARVGEMVGSAKDAAATIAILDAQCLRSFMRGEYREAQGIAESALRDSEMDPRSSEAGLFRRMRGLILLYKGELHAAQAIFERELTEFQLRPAGQVNAAAFLALTEWHLGEIEHARRHIQQAIQSANESVDAISTGNVLFFWTVLESRRDDASATRLAAEALLKLSEKHGMRTFLDEGRVYADWAGARLLEPEFDAGRLERALAAYVEQGNWADGPSLYGLLAELQASAQGPESALALANRGLAIANETGEHFTDSYLHRLRGELLLMRNPPDPTPAEEAFKAAITVARAQGARSYELLASLSLAKLHQLTGRRCEAVAILTPALEGFSPTPEMPQIAEAQALLAELS